MDPSDLVLSETIIDATIWIVFMDPWNFVVAHRYSEALALYDAAIAEQPRDSPLLANRAIVLLCLGRMDEALNGFRKAGSFELPRQRSTSYLNTIGTVQWIMGDRLSATETFRSTVRGVLDRSIEHTDFSGGASSGLLLWYSGVTTQDSDTIDEAEKSLRELVKRPLIASWPGPLALFALGRKQFETLLLDTFQNTNIDDLSKKAKFDVLLSRKLTKALFYRATMSRSTGDEGECRSYMRRCAALTNPHVEDEWYLARHEVGAPTKD